MSSPEERLRHNFAGFTVSENARVHAGDHYTNINNYSSQGIFYLSVGPINRWVYISLTATERSVSLVRPFSNVPFPHNPDYIDRTTISDEIHRKLVPGARLALVGLGGVV